MELKALELTKSKFSKDRVLHNPCLRGSSRNSITKVLNEKENRIVSIAAFLDNVTDKNNHTPFIFDDPIPWRDQIYEETMV